jgi:hypothetical protein
LLRDNSITNINKKAPMLAKALRPDEKTWINFKTKKMKTAKSKYKINPIHQKSKIGYNPVL